MKFFNITKGSQEELKYFIILSNDLNYISMQEQIKSEGLAEELSKILKPLTENLNSEILLLNIELKILCTYNFGLNYL